MDGLVELRLSWVELRIFTTQGEMAKVFDVVVTQEDAGGREEWVIPVEQVLRCEGYCDIV
jgi:hypothetical protein